MASESGTTRPIVSRPISKLPSYAPVMFASGTLGFLGFCSYLGFQSAFRRYNEAEAKERGGVKIERKNDAGVVYEPAKPSVLLRARLE